MTENVPAKHALILSGAGRFADPWHPFADTSAALASILRGEGFDVEIDERIDERMPDLRGVDLLVVNIGDPDTLDPALDEPDRAGLLAYLSGGSPILVMHVSSTSLPGVPEWESIIGGIWVRGTTMHPDHGLAHVRIYPERHEIVAPLRDFTLLDERYSYLRTAPDLVPLATHEHDGIEHPLLWARTYGAARVVYDALGHDARSYDSAEHRAIIARAARWLVGDLDA
jgi:type 1 glutamine amidotransferase